MKQSNKPDNQFDMRLTTYNSVKIIFVAVTVAFIIKYAGVDTVRMNGKQMAPSILDGDRLVVFRPPVLPIVRNLLKISYDKPVVVGHRSGLSVLRMVAYSQDTIRIDSGRIFSSHDVPIANSFGTSKGSLIPPEYIPRDFFETYRIPGSNDNLPLNKLSLRDFFFTASIIRQENPKDSFFVKAYLLLDDSLCENYAIADFMFYKGSLDSVPDSLRYNWFFWNRMEEYLYQKYSEQKVTLHFTIILGGVTLEEYRVKDNYYFLLADNRTNGLDSRYIGTIGQKSCRGVPVMALWSRGVDDNGKMKFRFNRMGKIIS